MGKNNVLDFKSISNKKVQEQFELEGLDEELLELVSKLVSSSPGSISSKKKELTKAELLKKIKEQRNGIPAAIELSDDELDSAAGGINLHNNLKDPTTNDPFNPDK
jgi:hypothetical protein